MKITFSNLFQLQRTTSHEPLTNKIMIIRCDNCSVSLQLDESKIPSGNFTVRCPRCQNLIRVQPGAKGASTVQQLKENTPAPADAGRRAGIYDKGIRISNKSRLCARCFRLCKRKTRFWTRDDDDGRKTAPRFAVSGTETRRGGAKLWLKRVIKFIWRKRPRKPTSGCAKAKPKS